jgi:hypothetical protein
MMSTMADPPRRFDPPALFAALDAERTRRALTWARVARDCGVAEATIRRLATYGRFEVDGVLALTQWLGRPLEEFTRPGELPPEALRASR